MKPKKTYKLTCLPKGENIKSMVHKICYAYEQGMGTGIDYGEGLENPYTGEWLIPAWAEGYEEGCRQRAMRRSVEG